MANRNPKRALGAAVFVQVGSGLDALGIRPRIRFWMTSSTSVDVAPGIVLYGSDGAPGFSGHAGVNFGDYVAVTTTIVALRPLAYEPNRSPRLALFAGGRLGAAPGAIVGGGSVALIAAVFLWCISERCFSD